MYYVILMWNSIHLFRNYTPKTGEAFLVVCSSHSASLVYQQETMKIFHIESGPCPNTLSLTQIEFSPNAGIWYIFFNSITSLSTISHQPIIIIHAAPSVNTRCHMISWHAGWQKTNPLKLFKNKYFISIWDSRHEIAVQNLHLTRPSIYQEWFIEQMQRAWRKPWWFI